MKSAFLNSRVLYIIILLLTIHTSISAQNLKKKATARIFESQSKTLSKIVVVYETGESEVIPLLNWKLLGGVKEIDEVLISNQKTINLFLNKMNEKGYNITLLSSTGESYVYTFIVFEKQE